LVSLAKDELLKTKDELVKMGEQLKQQAATGETSNAPQTTSFYGEILEVPPEQPSTAPAASPTPPGLPSSDFFSKIQSAANPGLTALQKNFQEALHKLPPGIQAGSKQAEVYLNKASKDLERYFNQAVQVLPPEAGAVASTSSSTATVKPAPTSRKEALIARLQSSPSILLTDPATPPTPSTTTSTSTDTFQPSADAREAYARFLQSIEDAGGLDSDPFQARIRDALAAPDAPLKATFSALVPDKMPAEAFWTRYFFRLGQIEEDDQRRRQVMQGALPFLPVGGQTYDADRRGNGGR
jgi:hypothetical protein